MPCVRRQVAAARAIAQKYTLLMVATDGRASGSSGAGSSGATSTSGATSVSCAAGPPPTVAASPGPSQLAVPLGPLQPGQPPPALPAPGPTPRPPQTELPSLQAVLVPQGHALHLSAGDSFFDKVKWKRGGNGKGAGSWRFRPHKHAGGKLSYRSELHETNKRMPTIHSARVVVVESILGAQCTSFQDLIFCENSIRNVLQPLQLTCWYIALKRGRK